MSVEFQQTQVQPGPCPPDPTTGQPQCPQPTEIDVIKVTRVFCEGYDIQNEEIEISFEAPTLEIITGDAQVAECVSSEVNLINCQAIGDNQVLISYILTVTARVPLDAGGYEYGSASKTVTRLLPCAGTEGSGLSGITPDCALYPTCQSSVISERDDLGNVSQVTSQAEIVVFVNKAALVQLLIPTYGPCQRPECGISQ
ncbi:MAG: hypothetical protein APF84_08615 [Gracilibacter sp. BRH_c7a]|nr:MAG: hypothetical protein APF84_08615 [Gracilibacter sp. BRH_c7a]